MSPFGWHPLHLVGNTDTLSEGPAFTRGSVGFLDFFLFLCPARFTFWSVSVRLL